MALDPAIGNIITAIIGLISAVSVALITTRARIATPTATNETGGTAARSEASVKVYRQLGWGLAGFLYISAVILIGFGVFNLIQQRAGAVASLLYAAAFAGVGYWAQRRLEEHSDRRPLSALIGACLSLIIATGAGWWLFRQAAAEPPLTSGSYWDVDGSLVIREATGIERKFVLVRPNADLISHGAKSGAVLFEGRRTGDFYDGTAYVFVSARCVVPYDARGPVLNNEVTVEISGNAPSMDPATCRKTGTSERKLVFNFKYNR